MPALLVLLLILVLALLFWITANVVGVLLTLLMAGVIGWLAESLVPGRTPFGWVGAVVAGLLGSWLGTALIGHVGPVIFRIPIVPALVGALILVVGAKLLSKREYGAKKS